MDTLDVNSMIVLLQTSKEHAHHGSERASAADGRRAMQGRGRSSHPERSRSPRGGSSAEAEPPRAPGATLQLHIVGPGGTLCTVSSDPTWRLPDLKAAVETTAGIRKASQRLFHETTELLGESVLQELLPRFPPRVELLLVRRTPEQTAWLEALEQLDDDSVLKWFREAPEAARQDREVMLAAAGKNGYALQFASAELKADRAVVLQAVTQEGLALRFASAELKADRAVVWQAVTQDGLALLSASAELKADRAMVLHAVAQNGFALSYASEELKADCTVVMQAVAQCGYALRFASAELKADRVVVLQAVEQNGLALQFASAELQAELDPCAKHMSGENCRSHVGKR